MSYVDRANACHVTRSSLSYGHIRARPTIGSAYSTSESPPNSIVPRGWPFHLQLPPGPSTTISHMDVEVRWCIRAGFSSPRVMNDLRVPPSLAACTLLRRDSPHPPSADTFVRPLHPLSLCLSFYFPLSLLPFHLDIPSPPSSLRHRVATLRWVLVRLFLLLILLLLRLLLLLLFYLAASSLVLFLVYFSHPRTVEMQFASELLLPPSQPVAASNNRRRSKQLTHQGEFVVSEEEISLI